MHILPSNTFTLLYLHNRFGIYFSSLRNLPYMILRRFLGTQTIWYLHSHTVCDNVLFITAPFVIICFGCSPDLIIRQGAFLLNTTA